MNYYHQFRCTLVLEVSFPPLHRSNVVSLTNHPSHPSVFCPTPLPSNRFWSWDKQKIKQLIKETETISKEKVKMQLEIQVYCIGKTIENTNK